VVARKEYHRESGRDVWGGVAGKENQSLLRGSVGEVDACVQEPIRPIDIRLEPI
jgi:hypothetical protein